MEKMDCFRGPAQCSGLLGAATAKTWSMKLALVLWAASALTLTGCASGVLDKAAVANVKRVAVVGYTFDYNMNLKDSFKSALMGGERTMGMMGKEENKLIETPVSKAGYDQMVQALTKMGWTVLDMERTVSSPTLKEFNEKRVKIGLMPLQPRHERQERTGVPQYHHVAGLVGKESSPLQKIAHELGVDALAFVYVETNIGNAASVGPFGVGATKYSSRVILDLYDPTQNKLIVRLPVTGEGVKEVATPKEFSGNVTEANTLYGVKKAGVDLVTELKKKL